MSETKLAKAISDSVSEIETLTKEMARAEVVTKQLEETAAAFATELQRIERLSKELLKQTEELLKL